MGWRRELQRAVKAREGGPTDPDTWQGRDRDPWWAEQKAKRDRERGL